MNELWSDCIRSLEPYTSGEQPSIAGLIKLNTNENPYPPSPTVLSALQRVANADLRLIMDYIRPNGSIVLANPNAPTGIALSRSQLRILLEKCPTSVVLIDEAYVDFGAESAVSLVNDFPNLLVIQTVSKSRALAGLRVGFAIGNADLIDALNIVKDCFNSYPLDRLALAGAEAAICDLSYFDATRQQVVDSREWLTIQLMDMGFSVLPSKANFLFVMHKLQPAQEIQHRLRQRNILVRYFPEPRISDFLRISIGAAEQCETLVHALREIIVSDTSDITC